MGSSGGIGWGVLLGEAWWERVCSEGMCCVGVSGVDYFG